MFDIIALCTCACVTTCFWCAVAALTHSSCPVKFHCVQNWPENDPRICPQPCCTNFAYPIFICPMEYASKNDLRSFLSTSASSAADATPEQLGSSFRVRKCRKPTTQGHEGSCISLESNSEQHSIVDYSNPLTPPPRARRNRLKSILESKFKRQKHDVQNCTTLNPPLLLTQNESDEGSWTESGQKTGSKAPGKRFCPEFVNSVPLFKMMCKSCRVEKRKCRCPGHPISVGKRDHELRGIPYCGVN